MHWSLASEPKTGPDVANPNVEKSHISARRGQAGGIVFCGHTCSMGASLVRR